MEKPKIYKVPVSGLYFLSNGTTSVQVRMLENCECCMVSAKEILNLKTKNIILNEKLKQANAALGDEELED